MANYEDFDKIIIKEERILKEDEVCRLCVEKCSEFSIIFQEDLHESLHSQFGMKILKTDNWPKSICLQCLNTAKVCLNFITTIRNSEAKLVESYGEWKEVEIKPDFDEVHIPDVNLKIESDWDPLEYKDNDESDNESAESKATVVKPVKRRRRRARLTRPKQKSKPKPPKSADKEATKELSEAEKRSMKRKESLESNIKQIEEFYKMICDTCQETFTNLRDLQQHYRNVHGQHPYIMCCNTKLLRLNKMLEHMIYHRDPEAFKCDECQKTFISSENRNLHKLKAHTPVEMHQFRCEKCPKTFVTYDQMRKHSFIHVPVEEREFKCPHCSKRYAMEAHLKFHIRYRHVELPPNSLFVCEICAKSFKIKENLKRHQFNHTQQESDKVPCPICQKVSKNKFQLQKHMKRHEENGKVFQCHICQIEKCSSGALKSHIRYVHMAERKHKCTMCEAAFKTPVALREHTATHSSSQILYTCSYCPKQFNSNANMYVHQKRKHPEEHEAARLKK